MAYEQKPGQFALFKNDKQGNDKRPDYRGDGLDLAGNKIRVSAWIKEGRNGKFMSCNFQLAEKQESKPYKEEPGRSIPPKTTSAFDDLDDGPAF